MRDALKYLPAIIAGAGGVFFLAGIEHSGLCVIPALLCMILAAICFIAAEIGSRDD
jgi:hypothetical protein